MKDSFIIEGKKYISSRRASAISGYASDYIGQLCRANKLDCKMIGRSWFVTEESLHLHKAAISREEANRNRIENLKGPKVQNVSSNTSSVSTSFVNNKVELSHPIASSVITQVTSSVSDKSVAVSKVNEVVKGSIKSPYTYSVDDRPLLPVLNKKVTEENLSKKVEKVFETLQPATKIAEKISIAKLQPVLPIKDVVELKKKTVAKEIESVKVSKKPARRIISYPELTRSIILKRVIAPAFVVVMFFGIGTGVYITADKVFNSVGTEVVGGAKMITANISDVFGFAYSSIKDGYKSIVAFFTSPARLALDSSPVKKEFGDVTVSGVTPNGIVLSSSTGTNTGDEVLKEKIAGSFSDEVEVKPDKSGTAGVITPVFKDTKGKDFVYVMVPVKDKAETKIP